MWLYISDDPKHPWQILTSLSLAGSADEVQLKVEVSEVSFP